MSTKSGKLDQSVKTGILRAAQEALIWAVRPYVVRELPGWGKLFERFGTYKQNWLWENSRPRTIRGKLHGKLMHLDLTHWGDRIAFFLGRWYDLPTQLFTLDFVRPGDTVIDVGANRGMFALVAQHAAGEHGRVICFEPNPIAADLLEQTIISNGITSITLHRAGLSDANAELTLSVPRINSGEGTFGQSAYAENAVYVVRAPVIIGDDALADVDPKLIKLDVEGFECRALRGLQKTLQRSGPVVITEIMPAHLRRCNTSVDALKELMHDLGYRGFKLGIRKHEHRYDWTLTPFPRDDVPFDATWLPPILPTEYESILTAHTLLQ